MKDGQGTMKYSNGDSYSGDFTEDLMSGHGKYRFCNGEYYEG